MLKKFINWLRDIFGSNDNICICTECSCADESKSVEIKKTVNLEKENIKDSIKNSDNIKKGEKAVKIIDKTPKTETVKIDNNKFDEKKVVKTSTSKKTGKKNVKTVENKDDKKLETAKKNKKTTESQQQENAKKPVKKVSTKTNNNKKKVEKKAEKKD